MSGKKQARKRSPRVRRNYDSFQVLMERFRQSPLWRPDIQVITPPLKVSAMVIEVMRPYHDMVDTLAAFHNLAILGTIAWNASLLSGPDRTRFVEQLLSTLPIPKKVRDKEIRQMINTMIRRKETLFPQQRYWIVDFEVYEAEDEYRLSVISLPMKDQDTSTEDKQAGEDRERSPQ